MKVLIASLLGLATIAFGFYWLVSDDFSDTFHSYVTNGDLLTLETRYTPEEIMDEQRNALIGHTQRVFQEPSFVFHPYLLCGVKYSDHNGKTRYGTILWSLVDGEMVINGDTWEKTRGFEDAIKAHTTPLEFRLLHALADHRGVLSRERLQKALHLDQKPLNSLIENARHKQLVIVKGNEVLLHFEDPLFHVAPETVWASVLVIKPHRQGKKITARYSHSSIERIAKAAFGDDFAIRSKKEVYLPVLRLSLQNPDGSLLITDWNAVTGEEIPLRAI
jgi:hypothetical protein